MRNHIHPVLLVVAAPAEAAAVARAFGGVRCGGKLWMVQRLSREFRLLETEIGKVNAACAVTRALERARYGAVVSLGVGGALPHSALRLRQVVLGSTSVYADEGVATPEGFLTCDQMGFPLGPFAQGGVRADGGLLERFTPWVEARAGRVGAIATVSTCSGTDELARVVEERTGGIAEGMEGAAVGHAAARFSDLFPRRGVAFIEIRVISNTTGARKAQRWDLRGALEVLTEVGAGVRSVLGAAFSDIERR